MVTKLKFLEEGYKFRAEFDLEGIPSFLMDEPKPVGEGSGPSSTQLLSAAIGHCLSSSLVYCLRKARIGIRNMETTVKLATSRNEEGRLRVGNIDVQIDLDVDEEDRACINRCVEVFENYCTVTQSVRKGIQVNVKVV